MNFNHLTRTTLPTITAQLQKAKTQKKVDEIVKHAWDTDNEPFFLSVDLSIKGFNLEKVAYIEGEDDILSGIKFEDFYKLAKDILSEDYSQKWITANINSLAENATVNEWNEVYRKILLGSYHKSLPMEKIIISIQKLTTKK